MKAFGVRLAAGAVTILLGAIMAAQAQKDQQNNTESAWTEEQIPPGKSVAPIGLLAELTSDQPSLAPLTSAEQRDVQSLKPVGENGWDAQPESDTIQLVQHVEPSAGFSLPGDGPDSTKPDNLGAPLGAPAGGRSVMKMRLPSFDFEPSTDAVSTANRSAVEAEPQTPSSSAGPSSAGPSFAIGMPAMVDSADVPLDGSTVPSGNPPTGAADHVVPHSSASQPKLSSFTFADTPTGVNAADSNPVAPPSYGVTSDPMRTDQPTTDQPPANDLRMGFSSPLPGSDAKEPVNAQVEFNDGPQLADSMNPNLGVPAAMLTPVLPGDGAEDPAALIAAPATTMRIQRDPAMRMTFGGDPLPTQVDTPHSAVPTMTGGQAMGYPSANQTLQTPQLPLPSLPAETFDAAPLSAPNAFGRPAQPPAGSLVGGTNQLAAGDLVGGTDLMGGRPQGGPIYQGVGYKQVGTDRHLPAGPTLASPGERFLDGPQSPSVVIHKRAPSEVKVGKPASFVITVKNVGGSKALDVQVHDRVPTGMILTDATPRPNPQYQPELYWELGDLEPNQERTITLQLTPEQEGELGSVARVTFQAAASVRTISTRPDLKVVQKAPAKVLIGQQLEIELEVSNPGTGEATGVVLQEDVPEGLEHPQGKQLDNLIGTLAPGEIRRQILRMRAVSPGVVQNQIRVKSDDGLETMHTVAVEVVAPDLRASLTGPSRRFLERQATYQLEIANVGTADATNVELSVQLDRGFTFVKTDFEGQYDSTRHAVFWSLPALTVGQSGTVPLTLLPVEEGERILRTEATADLGIRARAESKVEVASLAELTFSINDSADPIEVGGETVYEIRVSNSGSRDDTNVRVALQLPPGLQLMEQGDFTPQGQGILAFSPRGLLKANDQMVFKVKAQGGTPGTHLVKAIVTSDQSQVPVTKEESTMVYADQ